MIPAFDEFFFFFAQILSESLQKLQGKSYTQQFTLHLMSLISSPPMT